MRIKTKIANYNALLLILLVSGIFLIACKSLKSNSDTLQKPEDKLGWKLGAQAYTFRKYSFFEAVSKIDSCELSYVESYPTQLVGGGIEGTMDYKMEASKRTLILKKLQDTGVRLFAYGVIKANSQEEWRQIFEFCKAMGIETITSEPNQKDLAFISTLCDEYKINLTLHNHPKPSLYWSPDTTLAAISKYGKRIGACADIGHWVRSGLDPVESLKKLEGRILHLHMKDLNEPNKRQAHDVHWGTGVSNIPGVVAELKRQNFKGMISAEYEYNWDHNTPDVMASIKYFRSLLK